MNHTERKRRQIKRLYKTQNGLCYFCKKKMLLITNPAEKVKIFKDKKRREDLATLEHIDSRLSNKRKRFERKRIAVSCWRCNNDKAKRDEATLLSLNERRIRSIRGVKNVDMNEKTIIMQL